ncbi:hypothetical protein KOW79_019629 [Hemibagrus wyckioides]|uniref:TRIM8/14/16/25/29/45/65 coiled-coil region domain-containing protein n=2 Tax=Hemibagrus wyckioides TaxID=337641 RepID=A0A9D3SAF1_9TELE|nr:hypothetical protein KOW79_019629 [Hemibagrus wyckioides]
MGQNTKRRRNSMNEAPLFRLEAVAIRSAVFNSFLSIVIRGVLFFSFDERKIAASQKNCDGCRRSREGDVIQHTPRYPGQNTTQRKNSITQPPFLSTESKALRIGSCGHQQVSLIESILQSAVFTGADPHTILTTETSGSVFERNVALVNALILATAILEQVDVCFSCLEPHGTLFMLNMLEHVPQNTCSLFNRLVQYVGEGIFNSTVFYTSSNCCEKSKEGDVIQHTPKHPGNGFDLYVNRILADVTEHYRKSQKGGKAKSFSVGGLLNETIEKTDTELEHMIEERIQKMDKLKQSLKLLKSSCLREVQESHRVFSALLSSVEAAHKAVVAEVEEKQQEAEKRVEQLQKELEKEIAELKSGQTTPEDLLDSKEFLRKSFIHLPREMKDWSKVTLETEPCVGFTRKAVSDFVNTVRTEANKLSKAELNKLQIYTVELTLNSRTAHASLSLSDDRKQSSVQLEPHRTSPDRIVPPSPPSRAPESPQPVERRSKIQVPFGLHSGPKSLANVEKLLQSQLKLSRSRQKVSMATTGMQLLGLIMSLIGWVCGFLVCVLPMWRVTAFIGNNIVTAQITWEGLWMNCIVQSTGEIQCKVYDSMLALPSDMQAARGLTVLSIIICLLALALGVLGIKCTKCVGQPSLEARLARISGILFAVAGFLYLVPVCWTAHSIIKDFYNPYVAAPHKRELGPALYLGWGGSGLLLIGGSLLYAGSSPPGIPSSPTFSSGESSPRRAGGSTQVKGYV